MNRLGLEVLCVFGLPPVEFIELAASLGCGGISLTANTLQYQNPSIGRYSYASTAIMRRPTLGSSPITQSSHVGRLPPSTRAGRQSN